MYTFVFMTDLKKLLVIKFLLCVSPINEHTMCVHSVNCLTQFAALALLLGSLPMADRLSSLVVLADELFPLVVLVAVFVTVWIIKSISMDIS